MAEFQKTDTSKSPLLKPVIERDYTRGMGSQPGMEPTPGPAAEKTDPKDAGASSGPGAATQSQQTSPPPGDDFTKPFEFDQETGATSDLGEGEAAPGVTMPSGSAKSFANFVGNAIQLYLPKASYGYVKIDMENVIMNVEKGNLTTNWVDTFEKINKTTEEALQIPDEPIKMWKGAFKDWLEYKSMTFANPETAFIAATILLLGDQGIRVYSIKKSNEQYMREAIQASNPELLKAPQRVIRPEENKETLNPKTDESAKAA